MSYRLCTRSLRSVLLRSRSTARLLKLLVIFSREQKPEVATGGAKTLTRDERAIVVDEPEGTLPGKPECVSADATSVDEKRGCRHGFPFSVFVTSSVC